MAVLQLPTIPRAMTRLRAWAGLVLLFAFDAAAQLDAGAILSDGGSYSTSDGGAPITGAVTLAMEGSGSEEGPDEHLPEHASPEQDIVKQAVDTVLIDDAAIIIPESAYFEALGASSDYFVASDDTKYRGAYLAGTANNLESMGAFGALQFNEEPIEFSGDLFIVARDPLLSMEGEWVQARDFYVVAVELKGTSPWTGQGARIATASVGSAAGSCCGEPVRCVQVSRPSGPGPCGPWSASGLCGELPGTIDSTPVRLDVLEDLRAGGGWQPPPVCPECGFASPLAMSFGFGGGFVTQFEAMHAPGLDGLPPILSECFTLVHPVCTQAKPFCDYDADHFENSDGPVSGGGGDLCGFSHSGAAGFGRAVPEICTVIMDPGSTPSECGGYCPNCGLGRPRQVESPLPEGWQFLPPSCLVAKAEEGGAFCSSFTNPDVITARNTLWWARVTVNGCSGGLGAGAACCGTNCVCEGGLCAQCDGLGCHEFTHPPNRLAEVIAGEDITCTTGSDGVQECTVWADRLESEDHCQGAPGCDPNASFAGASVGSEMSCGAGQKYTSTGCVDESAQVDSAAVSSRFNDPTETRRDTHPPPGQISRTERLANKHADMGADPVLLESGALVVNTTDLDFPGPVRSLTFTRSYTSRSDDRGALGSNWTHNWEVRIQRLNRSNLPAWAATYCGGFGDVYQSNAGSPYVDGGAPPPIDGGVADGGGTGRFYNGEARNSACLILHAGDGSQTLFVRDLQTGLFLPQAGTTDTIAEYGGQGYGLRRATGDWMLFDEDGFLVQDRDRFGNGVSIEYESTPLFDLYLRHCRPSFPEYGGQGDSIVSGKCNALAFALGDASLVEGGWKFPNPVNFPLPTPGAQDFEVQAYAKSYLFYLKSLLHPFGAGYGNLKKRPKSVRDDLGRTLTFEYYRASQLGTNSSGEPEYDFASLPHADLLHRVRGPGGAVLEFEYSRPSDYPIENLESFLVRASRVDDIAPSGMTQAAHRYVEYQYQWPENPGPSYQGGDWLNDVYASYYAYYAAFRRCMYKWWSPCTWNVSPVIVAEGLIHAPADGAKREYMSRVADNIVSIAHGGEGHPVAQTTARIEVETRYDPDPRSDSFDRAVRQRYGGSARPQETPPPDPFNAEWQTNLPKVSFTYLGRATTSGVLPHQLEQRFPIEQLPGGTPMAGIAPTVIGLDNDFTLTLEEVRSAIALVLHEVGEPDPVLCEDPYPYFTKLPGYRPRRSYFEVAPGTPDQLRRSRLTCDQLREAMLGDVTHNDLAAEVRPLDGGTPPIEGMDGGVYGTVHRLVGGRNRIEADANRICAWTKYVNRNGDETYYGLNMMGQVLVSALKQRDSADYLVSETLRNADGLEVEQRAPTSNSAADPTSARANGYTVYTYEDITPVVTDGGHYAPPFYWSRRHNLTSRLEYAGGTPALDESERDAGVFTSSTARYVDVTYEPLFNQPRSVEVGSIDTQGGRQSTERTDYVFDYQELANTDSETEPIYGIGPVLRDLEKWGFGWYRDSEERLDFDYGKVLAWQLKLPLYGSDINGDGQSGFGTPSTPAGLRAMGRPVQRIQWQHFNAASRRITKYVWAPHGLPAEVLAPDGSRTTLEYYSVGSGTPDSTSLGTAVPPNDASVSRGSRGFLARVQMDRFAPGLPAAGQGAPCSLLEGPYQWLLPASCTDPRSELVELGLPGEAVEAVFQSAGTSANEKRLTHAFSYNVAGTISHQWSDLGVETFTRDVDGRVHRYVDTENNSTQHTYDVFGDAIRTTTADGISGVTEESERCFDEEHLLVYECHALSPHGCAGHMCDWGNAPDGSERHFSYWPEGHLRSEKDPAGLQTEYSYDERGLLRAFVANPVGTQSERREGGFFYDDEGRLVRRQYGPGAASLGGGLLFETFNYDSLDRLTTRIDTRQQPWQLAWSSRNLLTSNKQDSVPFGTAGGSPTEEVQHSYNEFGELTQSRRNGILVQRLTRRPDGSIYSIDAAGVEPTFVEFSLQGDLLWARDHSRQQWVNTWRPTSNVATSTQLRPNGVDGSLTTSSEYLLNSYRLPIAETVQGGDFVRSRSWNRDGRGFINGIVGSDGRLTTYTRNLLGWVTGQSQLRQTDPAPEWDVSTFWLSKRGELTRITDPSGVATTTDRNLFGLVLNRYGPGFGTSYTYDALGRPRTRTGAAGTITYEYDQLGDLEGVSDSGGADLARWTYDSLGRVLSSTALNPALTWLSPSRREVVRNFSYDELWRVTEDGVTIDNISHSVRSTWELRSTNAAWQRSFSVSTPARTTDYRDEFDLIGRHIKRDRIPTSGSVLTSRFSWVGDLQVGRSQDQTGWTSPFRQSIGLDSLGRTFALSYTAVDLNSSGTGPLHTPEAEQYCRGDWEDACAQPLLTVNLVRDSAGRVASLYSHFGFHASSEGSISPNDHPTPWRGFAYDVMSRLSRTWEHGDIRDYVEDFASLENHYVTESDVEAVGAGADSIRWDYAREPQVGGTTSIVSAAGMRWSLEEDRASHRLEVIETSSGKRRFSHDTEGRVTGDEAYSFVYDKLGRMAYVQKAGTILEAYLYDADGRLVGTADASQLRSVFAYDGEQMVAASDGAGNPIWEASWGPGLDQLIEWRNVKGGQEEVHIPLADHRNSVVATWKPGIGRIESTTEYNPEGRITVSAADDSVTCNEQDDGAVCANPDGMPFRFVSAWRSEKTGFVYMRNRWYSPEYSQFLTHDPLGYVDSYNPYAYVRFDPINGWDPFGLDTTAFVQAMQRRYEATWGVGSLNIGPNRNKEGPNRILTAASFGRNRQLIANTFVDYAKSEVEVVMAFAPDLPGAAVFLADQALKKRNAERFGQSYSPPSTGEVLINVVPFGEVFKGAKLVGEVAGEGAEAALKGVGGAGDELAQGAGRSSADAPKGRLRLGPGAAGVDQFVNKVVNSNMPHAAERAVERAGFSSIQEARAALQRFGAEIERSGIPGNAIRDTAHADRILVPGFGQGGAVVYQVRDGVLKLKTVLEWRPQL